MRKEIINRDSDTVNSASDRDRKHGELSYAWLTEFVTSADVITSVPTLRISGIPGVDETLADTPNVRGESKPHKSRAKDNETGVF